LNLSIIDSVYLGFGHLMWQYCRPTDSHSIKTLSSKREMMFDKPTFISISVGVSVVEW